MDSRLLVLVLVLVLVLLLIAYVSVLLEMVHNFYLRYVRSYKQSPSYATVDVPFIWLLVAYDTSIGSVCLVFVGNRLFVRLGLRVLLVLVPYGIVLLLVCDVEK